MREIVTLCDMCFTEDGTRVNATNVVTFGMVVGKIKPGLHEVDMCDDHLVKAHNMLEIWFKVGREAKPAPTNVSPTASVTSTDSKWQEECSVCGKEMASRSTLVGHVWSQHRGMTRPKQPDRCPICKQEFGNGAGMALHRQAEHGYDPLQEALAGVK